MQRFEAKRGKLLHVVIQQKQYVPMRYTSKEGNEKVVCNVFTYFKKQAKKGRVTSSPLVRTVKATGLSRATVIRIRREQKLLPEDGEFPTPTKRYCRTQRRVVSDDFNREAIRRRIYNLYAQKINITLNRLLVSHSNTIMHD